MDRLGKYEILGEIGQGGMGKIYRARDSVIGREVAIKVIQERAINAPEIRERFYREAQAAGRLSHENVMVIHDIGEHEGLPYIVMEYLRGTDLRKLLDEETPVTLDEKLQIAAQICEGLQYAHEHGIVHRDIKPDNIRILRGHRVKIMDFGIARLTEDLQTLTHSSIGTPRYMSPEQIKGVKVDQRSDIFSFGVLFYELLGGSNPFWGERVTTVIYKILHEEPEPVHVTGSRMEGDLQRIVARCLEKDPEKRYQDFGAVLADLNASLATRAWSTSTVQLPESLVEATAAGRGAESVSPEIAPGSAFTRRRVLVAASVLVLVAAVVWAVLARRTTDTDVPLVTIPTETQRDGEVSPDPPDEWFDGEHMTEEDQQEQVTETTDPSQSTIHDPPTRTDPVVTEAPPARREPTVEPTTPVAPEPDPLADATAEAERLEAEAEVRRRDLIQRQRTEAQQSRTLFREVRDGVDPEHRDAPAYREAGIIEARAEGAFEAEQFADASRHFESATRLLGSLPDRAPGPSPEALAEEAIGRLVARLSEGFEHEDLESLRAISPFFGTWRDFFDVAHAINARIESDNLRVSGDRATVQMHIELSYRDNRNRRQRTTLRQLWTLQQVGDAWSVSDVRAQ